MEQNQIEDTTKKSYAGRIIGIIAILGILLGIAILIWDKGEKSYIESKATEWYEKESISSDTIVVEKTIASDAYLDAVEEALISTNVKEYYMYRFTIKDVGLTGDILSINSIYPNKFEVISVISGLYPYNSKFTVIDIDTIKYVDGFDVYRKIPKKEM